MVITIQSQIYAFLVTVYGGFVLGFIYDIFKVTRQVFKLKKLFLILPILYFGFWDNYYALFYVYKQLR